MRIRRLVMENFRQFYGRQEIDFAGVRDGEPNVTVIFGENGRGKTTTFRALLFALYGRSILEDEEGNPKFGRKADLGLVNRIALEEDLASARQGVAARVEVEFLYEEKTYNIIRGIAGIIHDGQVVEEEVEPKLIITLPDGNTRVIQDENEIKMEIDQVLDRRIAHYFLFDGERIRRLTEAKETQRDEVRRGIRNILRIDTLNAAIQALSDVEKELHKELKKFSKGEALRIHNDLTDVRNRIEQVKSRLECEKKSLDELARMEAELEAAANAFDVVNEKLNEKKAAEAVREQHQEHLHEQLERLHNNSMRSLGLLMAEELLRQVQAYLANFSADDAYLPPVTRKRFAERLIKEGLCICGNRLEPGSDAVECLRSWSEEDSGSPSIIELNDFARDVAVLLGRSAELRKDAAAHLGTIARLREQIDSLNARLKELDEELDSLAPQPGAVQETLQRLRELSEQKMHLNTKIANYNKQLEDLVQEKNELDRQYDEELKRNKIGEEVRKQKELVVRAIRALEKARDTFQHEVAEQLAVEATRILKQLLDPEGQQVIDRIVVNHDWSLEVLDPHGLPILSGISAGQRQVVSLAFITAIARVASGERGANMPLFMDTPFGRLSGKHRDHLIRILPSLTPQWVLLATDTELTRVEAQILKETGRWGKLYVLQQPRRYVSQLVHREPALFTPTR